MEKKKPLVSKKHLFTFILITSLFALWGFANDITNPMVAAFQTLMELSATKASMVQFAFYGGYATMAIPAALFIRKYSYKSGILLGLALYAIGAFLFIPAAAYQEFTFFCLSLYILTFGLAFLETTANPFILSLGDKETSTRRLNMAQAFNPIGSLSGMAIASFVVLPHLISDKRDAAGQVIYHALTDSDKAAIRLHDLAVIRNPYVALGLVVLCMFILIGISKMPKVREEESVVGESRSVRQTLCNLWHNSIYREGVFAQICYVGAQIMVWTFIIQYANHLGINKATAQIYNMVAMSFALCGRFMGTYIMRYVNTRRLLMLFGIGASICTMGTICVEGMFGLYSLVLISLFMSIMFPTIYGIALEGVDSHDTKLGAAFLVMAIVGGALMPPLQGMIIDCERIGGFPAVNVSFILPLCCFLVVTIYGYRAFSALSKEGCSTTYR
ncbi:MAG: L-fucose:H+ symporter permease [Mediterranea massiliensis]|nr:L-fucose:H+ symporter permease [Mediterranea massiliensis]